MQLLLYYQDFILMCNCWSNQRFRKLIETVQESPSTPSSFMLTKVRFLVRVCRRNASNDIHNEGRGSQPRSATEQHQTGMNRTHSMAANNLSGLRSSLA